MHLVLDFVADSWDCCIWRLFRRRLEREYNLDLVTTAPGVIYKVYKTNGDVIELTNPSNLPDPSEIDYMEEPIVNAEDHGNNRVYRFYYGTLSGDEEDVILAWNI